MRDVLVLALVLVAAALPMPVAAQVLDLPVDGPVTAVFDAPTRYGAGHRGVDIDVPNGTAVRAAADGRVTFAGAVVGRRWVTVDHGGLRTTVGPLATIGVAAGDRVARGDHLGTSGAAHGRPAVHWSARRGATYVDPLAAGRLVASLVPDPPVRAGRSWPGVRVR